MFRFAVSIAQDINLRSLRLALFNYIYAVQKNDRFILRIKDAHRLKDAKERQNSLLDTLDIFGIKYSEIYHQNNNFKYHLQFASTLLDEKKAFMCFCTEDEINIKKELAKKDKKPYRYDGVCENLSSDYILNSTKPFVIRMKKPDKDISLHDEIKGEVSTKRDDIDSFVIMDFQKYPTETFASAIDDMLQGITDIIIDTDLLDSSRQSYIRESIGYSEKLNYTHISTLFSKEQTTDVSWLLNQGFMPEAITNYLLAQGNKTPKEIFTLNEAIEWFDIKNISQQVIRFDIEKLKAINKEHIKLLSDEELAKRVGYSGKGIGKLAKFYTKYTSTTFEIKKRIDNIFATKKLNNLSKEDFEILKKTAQNAPFFDGFEDFRDYLKEKSGVEKDFTSLLGILLTNDKDSSDLTQIYPLIKNYMKEVIK